MILIWCVASMVNLSSYLSAAIIVDGRIDLGTWERIGLCVVALFGPIGSLLCGYFIASQMWVLRHEPWWAGQSLRRLKRRSLLELIRHVRLETAALQLQRTPFQPNSNNLVTTPEYTTPKLAQTSQRRV